MSIIDLIRNYKTYKTIKSLYFDKLSKEDIEDLILGGTSIKISDKKYINSVFACIDTYGLYFSKAKFRVYDNTNPDNIVEVTNPAITRLFNQPNGYQTSAEIFYRVAAHFGLFGNSYLYKLRNQVGTVIGYQQLLPSLVKRVKENNSKNLFDYYQYANAKIKRDDIIDFRYPNPYSDIEGYPIIESIGDDITILRIQKEYSKVALERGGYLGLTFATDQDLSETTFKKLRKELEDRFGGQANAFKVALLTGGLKPLSPPYSPKDMQFSENKTITREEILSAFKIPKILLGMGESINRATAEASVYAFTSGVIDPLLSLIDQVLTNDFQKEFGEQYSVEHDLLTPKDVEGQLKYYSQGLKEGWLTINEVRKYEGLNKLDGTLADVPTINVGGALINVTDGYQIGSQQN